MADYKRVVFQLAKRFTNIFRTHYAAGLYTSVLCAACPSVWGCAYRALVDLETTCPPHQIERQGDLSWQRPLRRDRKRNSSVKANCIQPIKHVVLLKHRDNLQGCQKPPSS
ncbi:uncharacterized protein LOC129847344 isoform X2 [Salvelinus fontinalis]|uniref:uncharacterized protein LOC129847344 isoform X2 n=1 Tax=Salvelinus fontinalis TaxID=8038 RepID=UPI0024865D89|nr:uncharacterized protein LOC129847344 isoform X2 [Salvelinus fontinalis]